MNDRPKPPDQLFVVIDDSGILLLASPSLTMAMEYGDNRDDVTVWNYVPDTVDIETREKAAKWDAIKKRWPVTADKSEMLELERKQRETS